METLDKTKLSNDELIALIPQDEESAPVETAAPQATEAETPPVSEAVAAVEAAATDPAATAAEQPAEPPNTRAQLRASRRSEDRLQRELKQARQELAELKERQAAPAGKTVSDDDEIDAVIAELEPDLPAIAKVGKVVKELKAKLAALETKQPAPAPAEPEFEPEQLPPELQDIVDDMPDLYAWQHDKDQTKYHLAGRFNETLLASPKWKDKPAADRFAEVVRLVKDHSGDPPVQTKKAATTVDEARAAIEAKAKPAPVSVGDLRGRASPTQITSRRADWAAKTNDQILAEMQDV